MDETKAGAIPANGQDSKPASEPAKEPDLQAKYDTLAAAHADMEKQYKNIQRQLERRGPDPAIQAKLDTALARMDSLESLLKPLALEIASVSTREDSPLKAALPKFEAAEAQRGATAKETARLAELLGRELQKAGITSNDDERMVDITNAWMRDPHEAIAEAKALGRLAELRKKESEMPVDEKKLNELVDKRVRETMIEKGLLSVDSKTGTPGNIEWSAERILDLHRRMERGDRAALDEFRKSEAAINESVAKGAFSPKE